MPDIMQTVLQEMWIGHFFMKLLSLLLITPAWGLISPRLFFNGWLSFLGLVASLFCLSTRRVSLWQFASLFFTMMTRMLFFFTLLIVGFYFFSHHFSLGFSLAETVVFTVFAIVQTFFLLLTLSERIDEILSCIKSGPDKWFQDGREMAAQLSCPVSFIRG